MPAFENVTEPLLRPLIVPLSNVGEPPSCVSVCGAASALVTAIFVPALTVDGSGS